jgi:hypothetical protein
MNFLYMKMSDGRALYFNIKQIKEFTVLDGKITVMFYGEKYAVDYEPVKGEWELI